MMLLRIRLIDFDLHQAGACAGIRPECDRAGPNVSEVSRTLDPAGFIRELAQGRASRAVAIFDVRAGHPPWPSCLWCLGTQWFDLNQRELRSQAHACKNAFVAADNTKSWRSFGERPPLCGPQTATKADKSLTEAEEHRMTNLWLPPVNASDAMTKNVVSTMCGLWQGSLGDPHAVRFRKYR